MAQRTVAPFFLVAAFFIAVPAYEQQTAKPFTQEQVSNMVRDGFGDESGAKLIEQRGIDFAPSEDFMRTLKAAGASEAFLAALRSANPPEAASAAGNEKPPAYNAGVHNCVPCLVQKTGIYSHATAR